MNANLAASPAVTLNVFEVTVGHPAAETFRIYPVPNVLILKSLNAAMPAASLVRLSVPYIGAALEV